jgi:hypothetical protein
VAGFKELPHYEPARWLGRGDTLEVPDMFWRIDHRFKDLIDNTVVNAGLPIVEALQTIELRLDRSGFALESKSIFPLKSDVPRALSFGHSFLLYVQKRDAERPFFVLWVDNAELLTRQ